MDHQNISENLISQKSWQTYKGSCFHAIGLSIGATTITSAFLTLFSILIGSTIQLGIYLGITIFSIITYLFAGYYLDINPIKWLKKLILEKGSNLTETGLLMMGGYAIFAIVCAVFRSDELFFHLLLILFPMVTMLIWVGSYMNLPIIHYYRSKEEKMFSQLEEEGVEFCCTSCAANVSPNYCYCPSCKKKHDYALMPSEFGVYREECLNCSYKLPTLFARRQELNIGLYCPHCSGDVSTIVGINKHFVFTGSPSAGKTTLCIEMIKNFIDKEGATIIDKKQKTRFNRILKNMDKDERPNSLLEEMDYKAFQLLHQPENQKHPNQLYFYDIDNKKELKNTTFYKNIKTIFFLIDPYSNAKFRTKNGVPMGVEYESEALLTTLRNTLQALEKYHSHEEIKNLTFDIILTKTDTGYLDNVLPSIKSKGLQNQALENFIKTELEGEAFIHHIKQQFKTVNFHTVSTKKTAQTKTVELPSILIKELCKNVNVY